MNKAYPHYLARKVDSLDGLWEFQFFAGMSLEAVDSGCISWTDRQVVPGAFDAGPRHLGKRGTGAYRKFLNISPGTSAKIEFEAISFACRVFIDGVCLAENFCGFSPFEVFVPASTKARRELIVLAENRFDISRIPMHEIYFDFYQYGGIIRSAWLHHLPVAHIEHLRVDATDYRGGHITVQGKLSHAGRLMLSLPDEDFEPVEVRSREDGSFEQSLHVPGHEAWSPQSPRLYRLKASCGADDTIVRFGIREIRTEGRKILLNGEAVMLLGYNRHEFFPNYGPATPFAQMADDVYLLKDCGCNFVRGAHYHQDQRFLDLCDELGLLVWEENLGWGQRPYALENGLYQSHHQDALEAMVRRSYNHPSVVIWGFLNEAATDSGSFGPVFERAKTFLRREGGNRLITYASNRWKNDRYFEEVDLVCINCYPGWYDAEDHEDPLSLIEPFVDDILCHLKERGLDNKPFMISEIGCEGLYGCRDALRVFHSEEFQVDYLTKVCEIVLARREQIAGLCLWHFSDVRTYPGGRAIRRPRGFNNKGTFDEYRRPKLALTAIRNLFRGAGAEDFGE